MDAYPKIAPPSRIVTAVAVTLFVTAALAAAVLSWIDHHRPVLPVSVATRPHTGLGNSPESWPSATAGPQAELDFTHRDDLATLDLLGQYAAELAAPPAGRTGPATVLAEHQRLRRAISSDEHLVVLLLSTDLAHPASDAGRWLTLALGDFPDPASVTAWCHTVDAPHCVPRRLDPPR
ncbi:hypothetical protein SAMN06264365_10627 [Actinoplanes regularis]|uniref:Uncharacterized protein n=1 Tax=Actinoplanes regularis TaxID=52697 RepID=A0A238ZJ30_9ACTN|nr:hypothetical protein Are01nite_41770 [Actinoplanes regularis]SNR82714.1 hypothetical protein SAMN06264365_10627 [Actinoplanes regularis]